MRESKVEEHLVKRVKALGGEVRKVGWIGRANAPDRLVLFPQEKQWTLRYKDEQIVISHPFVELKRPTKGATAAQAREHERLRAAGLVVLVLNSIEAIDEVFG